MLAGIYAFRFQIAENLTQHIFVTGFVEIRDDDFLRIGNSGGAIQAELISRPFPEQLIASRLSNWLIWHDPRVKFPRAHVDRL